MTEIMKNLQKTFLFTFVLLLTLSGCIGQKGEKKADCAANQSFDQRSRQCVGAQKPPQPLLDDITIFEDQGAQTITLSYTDPNGSEANSCRVNFADDNVWLRAPEWDNAAARASQAHSYGFTAANSISPGLFPVQRGNAFAQEAIANASRLNAAAARTNAQMVQSIRLVADSVRQIGNIALGIPDSIVQARGADAIAEAVKMDQLAVLLENMCSCVGGICKTVAVPDKNWFGDVGFSYTISDSFGTGPTEQVTLSVQSMNDTPHPQPQDVNDDESRTSAPINIVFTVNAARDVEDDIFSNFFTYSVTNGTNMGSYIQLPKGQLRDCMGIGGSATTDRTCTYIPSNGDDSGVGSQAAAYNFQGIDWFAKSTGAWGNDIKVTFVEHPITRMGGLNGADGEKTVDITVIGKEITIMIESGSETVGFDNYQAHTAQNVVDAINADPYASALLIVTPVSPAAPVAPGSVTLASGNDGYDFIKYKVNDGLSDSSWEGVVSINIFAQNDKPYNTFTNSTLLEDSGVQTLTLTYNDVETGNTGATGCTAQSFTNGVIQPRSDCTCSSGVCTVDVEFLPNVNTLGQFQYSITVFPGVAPDDVGNLSTVNLSVTPINDPPLAYPKEFAATESPTAEATPLTFQVPAALDVDGNTVTYTLTTPPSNGTLTGCVSGTTLYPSPATCIYTPVNGNVNGNGSTASRTINGVLYTSEFSGAIANNIEIQITQTYGVADQQAILYIDQESTAGTLKIHAKVAQDDPTTLPVEETTAQELADAINSHPYLGLVVDANTAVPGTPGLVQTNVAS
ncbi:MAG: hypothetical protein EP319_16915, partial [Deltaproteobacteria bacterium]